MQKKKNEEQKTIYEKWEEDSKLPNGGISFDDTEWDGKYIEIRRPNENKDK